MSGKKDTFDTWESYFDQETSILKNLVGAKTWEDLEQKETIITYDKIDELQETPVKGDFDLEHLKAIHKHNFGDIYEWAGEIRTVNS